MIKKSRKEEDILLVDEEKFKEAIYYEVEERVKKESFLLYNKLFKDIKANIYTERYEDKKEKYKNEYDFIQDFKYYQDEDIEEVVLFIDKVVDLNMELIWDLIRNVMLNDKDIYKKYWNIYEDLGMETINDFILIVVYKIQYLMNKKFEDLAKYHKKDTPYIYLNKRLDHIEDYYELFTILAYQVKDFHLEPTEYYTEWSDGESKTKEVKSSIIANKENIKKKVWKENKKTRFKHFNITLLKTRTKIELSNELYDCLMKTK